MPRKKLPNTKARDALANVLPPASPPTAEAPPTVRLAPRAETLRKIVENPPPRPSVQAFLDHWFALRGGPAQFALDLCREYDAAEAGSQIRQRIVEIVMRSMKVADTKDGSLDELGLVSDADLDRLLESTGNRLVFEATTPSQEKP